MCYQTSHTREHLELNPTWESGSQRGRRLGGTPPMGQESWSPPGGFFPTSSGVLHGRQSGPGGQEKNHAWEKRQCWWPEEQTACTEVGRARDWGRHRRICCLLVQQILSLSCGQALSWMQGCGGACLTRSQLCTSWGAKSKNARKKSKEGGIW